MRSGDEKLAQPIVIIPARGGSKRVPRKNIRPFCGGKPLISHIIEKARNTEIFNTVYVSTDDNEIADVSEERGARILRRPDHLADDHSTTGDVMSYELSRLKEEGKCPDMVCCLYATAILISPERIREGFEKLKQGYEFVFSALAFEHPIERAIRLNNGRVKMDIPENSQKPTSDFEPAYYDAGQFYWGERDSFIAQRSAMQGENSSLVVCDSLEVVDIDTEADWHRAEKLFNQ